MMVKNIPRTYRQDGLTIAYLDALDKKLGGGHSALVRKAIANLAEQNFDKEELKQLQIEVLFNEFRKVE